MEYDLPLFLLAARGRNPSAARSLGACSSGSTSAVHATLIIISSTRNEGEHFAPAQTCMLMAVAMLRIISDTLPPLRQRLGCSRYPRFLKRRFFSALTPRQSLLPRVSWHGLYGKLDGHSVLAMPNTQSPLNVLSEDFAHYCGIEHDREAREFDVGNGAKVTSAGRAEATWRFIGPGCNKDKKLSFEVMPKSSSLVLLGSEFLLQHDTLRSYQHRLFAVAAEEDTSALNVIGEPDHGVVGMLEYEPVIAIPATGSELNIMSAQCAEERGLLSILQPSTARSVVLANGDVVRTLGKIVARWTFADNQYTPIFLDFDVLPGCKYDLMLGHEVLYNYRLYFDDHDCLVRLVHGTPRPLRSGVGMAPYIVRLVQRQRGKSFRESLCFIYYS